MTLALLLPVGLAALAALLLPLLIHLARRSEQRPTVSPRCAGCGRNRKPRASHPLRRMACCCCCACCCSRRWRCCWRKPVLFGSAERSAMGGGRARCRCGAAARVPSTTRRRGGIGWRRFPALDQPPPAAAALPFASLLRQLDAELACGGDADRAGARNNCRAPMRNDRSCRARWSGRCFRVRCLRRSPAPSLRPRSTVRYARRARGRACAICARRRSRGSRASTASRRSPRRRSTKRFRPTRVPGLACTRSASRRGR